MLPCRPCRGRLNGGNMQRAGAGLQPVGSVALPSLPHPLSPTKALRKASAMPTHHSIAPDYPGLTLMDEGAAYLGVHRETLREWLRDLGSKPVRRPGPKGDGYGTTLAYVRNSDLSKAERDHRPSRPIDDEITVQEAARLLFPDE